MLPIVKYQSLYRLSTLTSAIYSIISGRSPKQAKKKEMPLNGGACSEAERTMRKAFENLKLVITITDITQLENLALDDVETAALKIEKQLAASQSLRNMRRLAPLFRNLKHFSAAIEVLCSGTPYLPWIWAPIKLVLEVCSLNTIQATAC
jgi:hypothetical protein